jgi:3-oxoacyl-[acyl-carrier protein] reductase
VTGGARGIGAAVARRLASDGHAVAVLDREVESAAAVAQEIQATGGVALAIGADVADEESVTRAFEDIAGSLGAPTIVVNNAGITRDALVHKMTLEQWDSVLGVHLTGSFLAVRAAQPHMRAAGFGRIVNLSSTGALGSRGQSNYSSAKAGLQGLTKTLAMELGRFGVTANAIAPGFIETEMTVAAAAGMGMTFEELKALGEKQIAVGRIGQPADIAAAVSFLTSDEAGFISGQVLYVSGGPAA